VRLSLRPYLWRAMSQPGATENKVGRRSRRRRRLRRRQGGSFGDRATPAEHGDRLPQTVRRHVVGMTGRREAQRVLRGWRGCTTDRDLDEMADAGPRPFARDLAAPGDGDVIVLDQPDIIEADRCLLRHRPALHIFPPSAGPASFAGQTMRALDCRRRHHRFGDGGDAAQLIAESSARSASASGPARRPANGGEHLPGETRAVGAIDRPRLSGCDQLKASFARSRPATDPGLARCVRVVGVVMPGDDRIVVGRRRGEILEQRGAGTIGSIMMGSGRRCWLTFLGEIHGKIIGQALRAIGQSGPRFLGRPPMASARSDLATVRDGIGLPENRCSEWAPRLPAAATPDRIISPTIAGSGLLLHDRTPAPAVRVRFGTIRRAPHKAGVTRHDRPHQRLVGRGGMVPNRLRARRPMMRDISATIRRKPRLR